jgi:Fe-S oxidoreductase
MRALPMLEPRRAALEKCVFCPKLCRSSCPVSNAEPRETLTPWGKMSAAWMTAHGDVPVDASHAAPAWACTGCFACRESCDHRNEVADVLTDARDALARQGVAPAGATRILARFGAHEVETRTASRALALHPGVRSDASDALLIGCGYLRGATGEAGQAIDATVALTGRPVALVEGCCGLPLGLAGDARAFQVHARQVARSLERHARVFVVDAGCALALKRHYAQAGVDVAAQVELLVELASRALPELSPASHPNDGPVRWHDPCQLGRGLGIYEAPRAVLTRALGRPPDELDERRHQAVCSGAGGLLPATMPEVARAITDERLASHARAGGGRIVTACASSLIALRKQAAGSGVEVDDLVTWIARAAPRRSEN